VVANGLGIRLPPPNNSFFENGGQNTGKGYEYTLTYHDDRLTVRAGWVTVDVRDTTPGVLGEQVAGQPPARGQLHVRYRFPNVGSHGGFAIGAGLVHVGDRPVTTAATAQKIPSFETYSLNARYNLAKDFVVALAVNNLTDVRRVVSNSGSAIFRPSNPRTFQLSLTKSW
jgi:outer membrane receptor protein involved in Fe transport